jgi:hypothetical protein
MNQPDGAIDSTSVDLDSGRSMSRWVALAMVRRRLRGGRWWRSTAALVLDVTQELLAEPR